MARIVYIDCSPMMTETLKGVAAAGGMRIYTGDPGPAELAGLLDIADVVLNGHTMMDAALLGTHRNLRSIVFLGTGATSYIDVEAAAALGMRVRTIRGYGDRTVAEHAFGLLLAAARDTVRMDRHLRAGVWTVSEGIELAGRTLGIVGLGGVGAEMARIASAFGMKVVAWNRSGVPQGVPAEAMSLDDVLATADAVSLHLALTPQTKGLISTDKLARMKRGAILVNTARGAVVDEAALIEALRSGHIAHAAFDVFGAEPLPAGHQLTTLDNVTLTAHSGWKSRAASRRMMEIALRLAAEDAAAIDAGQPLKA